ncbi:MAG: antiterminator LoaP [Spirochaetales bacterium]|nr:antiterminator LoaP [Spirochaetales bacterium]
MNYYAVQVRTGDENRFIELARQNISRSGFPESISKSLLWPRRALTEKKRGKSKTSLKPLYPGYLFYLGEDLSPELHWAIRRTPGFFRFLKDNQHIEPLTGADREVLMHFLNFGEVAEKSKVYFNENNKIVVESGPMKGLEGLIVRVDRRKGRAKIRLSLNKNSLLVDLGFDVIKSAEENNGKQE